ncbi:MAG: hypothetical protein ACLQVK_22475 [Acidimicrobiales bacterium]|jgi:hypothetical protein
MQAQQYVGIDLHRRRSVIVRMDSDGKKLSCVRLPNDPIEIAEEMAKAGESPEVVIEATYGWYWLVDLLQGDGSPQASSLTSTWPFPGTGSGTSSTSSGWSKLLTTAAFMVTSWCCGLFSGPWEKLSRCVFPKCPQV